MNKRICAFLFALVLILSMSVTVFAGPKRGGDELLPGCPSTANIVIQFDSVAAFARGPYGGEFPPGYCPNN